LKTTGDIIDSKEGDVKLQFPHKKCMEQFPRKKEVAPRFKLPYNLNQVSKPSYMTIKKALYGRQPEMFFIFGFSFEFMKLQEVFYSLIFK
jgi:hypothetical protein